MTESSEPRDHRLQLDIAASVGLALFSFVAALGFIRVFGDWEFVSDVLTIVVVGHGLSFMLRRLQVPGLVAVLLVVAALAWTLGWLYYPDSFNVFLPTADTWDVAWADIGLARTQFRDAVAPVAYVGGWAMLAGIGTAFVVFAGDTFAFRAHARGEALVPGGVLFVFVAAVGADRHRIGLTLALVAAGFLAASLLRARFTQSPRTQLGRARNPLSLILPAAVGVGALVVLGAWIIGPRLPGARAEALVDTSTTRGGVTEVLSPLVDIRSRLVKRATTELFVVWADDPAYWRATALPEFDGNTWGLPDRSLEDVGGSLSAAAPGSTENRQEIVVSALQGALVPAAAEPVAAAGEGLRWNAETSTLVRVDRPLEEGDVFEIVSAMPTFSPETLRAATSAAPPDPIYTELPDDFPAIVSETAQSVTAGSPTTYDAMLTLQNWFRTNFEYSTEVPQGHGNSAIEAFLRQRIGYCEQFAGTFAAMARSLGVPARVAVGFTPGLPLPDGARSVLGKNAHAWPEIWFDGVGWVPFEPTPGRGAPGAEAYTGLPAAQDEAAPGPATEAPAEAGDGAASPATAPPVPAVPVPIDEPVEEAATTPRVQHTIPAAGFSWTTVGFVLLILGALVALPTLVRRWRRHHNHADVGRQILGLWQRALGAVAATGVRIDASLTPLEQARAIAPTLPVAARPLKSLADATTAATYAPEGDLASLVPAPTAGEPGPRRWCRQIERIAIDSMPVRGRVRRYFTVWS